jgi:hypothetical protein
VLVVGISFNRAEFGFYQKGVGKLEQNRLNLLDPFHTSIHPSIQQSINQAVNPTN